MPDTLDAYIEAIDRHVWRRLGVSVHDLADAPFADFFEDEIPVSEAVQHIIEYST